MFARKVGNTMDKKTFTIAAAAIGAAIAASAETFLLTGGASSFDGGDAILTFTESGTLHVTGSGTIDVLLVGGGGGSGAPFNNTSDLFGSGGGGGGGVVYQRGLSVTEGDYAITVGAGGAGGGTIKSNKGTGGPASNGGDTMAFGLTAYGGGAGGHHNGNSGNNGADGGSGGGGVSTYSDKNRYGGSALDNGSQGNKGGDSNAAFCPGGGGGAGAVGEGHGYAAWSSYGGGKGGDGTNILITGSSVCYGGGGAGYAPKNTPKSAAGDPDNRAGGAGGGASGELGKGTDGLGGGGSGGGDGGSGVVIVRYTPSGAESFANTSDFAISGGDSSTTLNDGTALTFTKNGTLTVTGSGIIDVLLVGGGGGSGSFYGIYGCGGGGGGGFVYATNLVVMPGSYEIKVGAGGVGGGDNTGEMGEPGGDSSAFGITAFGGGYGSRRTSGNGNRPGGDGASGGGGVCTYSDVIAGGTAIEGQGHPGGAAYSAFAPGGGGGAGENGGVNQYRTNHLADDRGGGAGGAGKECSITGTAVVYGGGGAGYCPPESGKTVKNGAGGAGGGATGALGKGTDGLGGGGSGGGAGGSGVVIVRMRKTTGAEVLGEKAEGGERIATVPGYRAHKFTTDGTFTMPVDGYVDVLLVGGGGGSGTFRAQYGSGGGGGGGVIYKTSMLLAAGTYPVAIGAGGAGGYDHATGEDINGGTAQNGGDTSAFGLTAFGGGAGGRHNGSSGSAGSAGASGGGAVSTWTESKAGGATTYPDQGNSGGDCFFTGRAGGGGGAGAAGETGTNSQSYQGSNGGAGRQIAITAEAAYYGGGGAGVGYKKDGTAVPGVGGVGGGGSNSAGVDGLGGGGSGGYGGGSGVVIIRYRYESHEAFVITVR